MNVTGLVHKIGETEEVGNNGFTKRQLVIETQEQYKQTIPIDFVKDKTSLLDKFKVGDNVGVSVNIRGNEYNGKYYVNLQGWKIEDISDPTKKTEPKAFEPAPDINGEDETDGMPF